MPTSAGARMGAFSDLERRVIGIARDDGLSTVRPPAGVRAVWQRLIGGRRDPRLANPRLEALRRMAVLVRQGEAAACPAERGAFFAAGFSADQYAALSREVSAAPR